MSLYNVSESQDLITQYCEDLSNIDDDLLYQLERETALKTLAPQMMSGKLQGKLLQMLVQISRPSFIVEVGTFTGYSTICMARGLPANGKLISYEVNPEISYISEKYVALAGLEDHVDLVQGDAKELIPNLHGGVDFVFLDGNKSDYPVYLDLILPKLKDGALVLADNTLWSGKVAQQPRSLETEAIHQFNQSLLDHPRLDVLQLPVRDGLAVCRYHQ